ncbi:hypothetical protein [Citricoccus muralis]|uniref:Uncharacterized protein n=1 Tax=Citricoccus muralis TaxID=169134 RepID=A0A3D9LE39_9MICC|nr:hypothetical protein [Citricoccus muralis]REE03906.1 hypothetical protein C8E99_1727 [Citricoccus muralis]
MGNAMGWAGSTGIGLAVGLGLLYVVLRGTAWSPGRGDPVRAVRTHAMIAALIALFASGTAGLAALATPEQFGVFGNGFSNGAFPVTTETDGETVRSIISAPLPPLPWYEALGIALSPVVAFVLVYAVAQYTWPRQTGAVRMARLSDRRASELLPRHLTGVTAVIMLAAAGLVALAWQTPAVRAREITETWRDEYGGSESSWFEPGSRGGGDIAPWLLLALVLAAVGFAIVLRIIARRPTLTGLHPRDDDLVRRIAVNRALRTVAVMMLGIGAAGFNAWANADAALARHTEDRYSTPFMPWLGLASLLVMLVLLFWRSPHVAELGSHTVQHREAYDAGPSPRSSRAPGTARAVLRLRLDGATLAWMVAAPIAALVGYFSWALPHTGTSVVGSAGPAWGSAWDTWSMVLWSALPCAAALVILGFTEFGVRRGHSPSWEPATTGKSSRWPVYALGLSMLLAAVWCVLCLTTKVQQTELATALAATTAAFALTALALARLALHRPPLGHATAEQDAAIRTGGANRLLAVGAAGILSVTGAALLAGVQVWHGFISGTILNLGINDLPDGLLLIRTLTVFALFGLIVACVIAPAPDVPGARLRPRQDEREAAREAEREAPVS